MAVNKKPSATKKQALQDLITRINNYGTSFSTNWTNVEKAFNKLGVDEKIWDDIKYSGKWQDYLGEDFEESGKDDTTAQKNADDEADDRMKNVSERFCKAVVNYFSDLIKYETSNSVCQAHWNKLGAYVGDTTNLNDVEKDFLGKNPLKQLIDDARTRAVGGGTTHTTTPTGTSTDDWKNVGLGQRYYGEDDLQSVGFCMRYLKTS